MSLSRRSLVKGGCSVALAGLGGNLYGALPAQAAGPTTTLGGVPFGIVSFSFHDIPIDGKNHVAEIVRDMKACGLTRCELFVPQIEHGGTAARAALVLASHAGSRGSAFIANVPDAEVARKAREDQINWRATVPISFWEDVGRQFHDAGIDVPAYGATFFPDASEAEISRQFDFARAMGAKFINSSTTLTTLKRIIPHAEKHNMRIAVHNHGGVADPNQISLRDSFVRAFAMSPIVWANLDMGHYYAAGGDPIAFLDEFHDRITVIHLKDRLKNDGPGVPFGTGDVPLREFLLKLKKERYGIPAFVEYEYASKNSSLVEIQRSIEYCRKVLEA